jgi:hypothetical protein
MEEKLFQLFKGTLKEGVLDMNNMATYMGVRKMYNLYKGKLDGHMEVLEVLLDGHDDELFDLDDLYNDTVDKLYREFLKRMDELEKEDLSC